MEQNQNSKPTLKLNKQVVAILDQAQLMAIKGGQIKTTFPSDVCTSRTGTNDTQACANFYRDEESI